jgi:hypothetical protein
MSTTQLRSAEVAYTYANRSAEEAEGAIGRYLPDNFHVTASRSMPDGTWVVTVQGADLMGWTLDGYVLPRLGSGLHFGREVPTKECAVASCDRLAVNYIEMASGDWGDWFCRTHQVNGLMLCGDGALTWGLGAMADRSFLPGHRPEAFDRYLHRVPREPLTEIPAGLPGAGSPWPPDREEMERVIPQGHLDRAERAYQQQQMTKFPGPNYPDHPDREFEAER